MHLHFSALPLAMLIGSMCAASCSSSPAQTEAGAPSSGSSTEGGDDGPTACMPYDGGAPSSLMMPTRSFNNDVMPIFTFSCDFSGCHDVQGGMPLEYLGDSGNGQMPPPYSFASMVYSGIVNKPTTELPSMMFVKPGDPTNSYMMRKLDNALCDLTCVAGNPLSMMSTAMGLPCGTFMPASSQTILPQAKRDIVREWIAQGAMNN